jgi:predicted nucleic acid-binding protein
MKLIDTSSWIHALRPDGDPEIRARIAALLHAGEAAWCPMVRLELWNGARGRHEKQVLKEMQLNLFELEMIPQVWDDACSMAQEARTQGLTIPATDLLIAACARHYGVGIEHSSEHFDALAALKG